jgi:hypothetical protein
MAHGSDEPRDAAQSTVTLPPQQERLLTVRAALHAPERKLPEHIFREPNAVAAYLLRRWQEGLAARFWMAPRPELIRALREAITAGGPQPDEAPAPAPPPQRLPRDLYPLTLRNFRPDGKAEAGPGIEETLLEAGRQAWIRWAKGAGTEADLSIAAAFEALGWQAAANRSDGLRLLREAEPLFHHARTAGWIAAEPFEGGDPYIDGLYPSAVALALAEELIQRTSSYDGPGGVVYVVHANVVDSPLLPELVGLAKELSSQPTPQHARTLLAERLHSPEARYLRHRPTLVVYGHAYGLTDGAIGALWKMNEVDEGIAEESLRPQVSLMRKRLKLSGRQRGRPKKM